jgi:hypothetical protein
MARSNNSTATSPPKSSDWRIVRQQIRRRTINLQRRLLPNLIMQDGLPCYDQIPPKWHPWKRPAPAEPIDDVVRKLKLRPAALERRGVRCPFWFARCGIVIAVETADLVQAEVAFLRRHYDKRVLDRLIADVSWLTERLNRIAVSFHDFDAALRLNPYFRHQEILWAGDALFERWNRHWHAFRDDCEPFANNLSELCEIALIARRNAVNNPPDEHTRTFARIIQQNFNTLTESSQSWQTAQFADYHCGARTSAGLPEISGDRLLKKLHKLDGRL